MAWKGISGTLPQYEANGVAASGYFLKFYAAGTTTVINMATDSSGATTLAKSQLDSEGYPLNGSSARFVPHINAQYKIVLYSTEADADANALASAVWAIDNLTVEDHLNIATYELGSEAAVASHPGASTGYVIETTFLNTVRTAGSGSKVTYTGTTISGKAGGWPNADSYFYDADGKQFEAVGSILNGLAFGMLPGNTTNQITAFNTTITAAALRKGSVFIPTGTYAGKSTMLIDGDVNVFGEPGTIIQWYSTGAYETATSANILVLMGRDTIWSGDFHHLEFTFNGASTFDNLYPIVIWYADIYEVHHIKYTDCVASSGGTGLGHGFTGMNITAAGTKSSTKGRIHNNFLLWTAANTKMEAISTSVESTDVKVYKNFAEGFGDDAFAAHAGNKINIIDNDFITDLGRILLAVSGTNISDFKVVNNRLTKVNSQGASNGIAVFPVNDSSLIMSNVLIHGNTIVNNDDTYDMTNPIILRGGSQYVTITDNIMVNNRGAGAFHYKVSSFSTGAVTHVTNNLVSHGNQVYGGGIDFVGTSAVGWHITDDFADGADFLTGDVVKYNTMESLNKHFMSGCRGVRSASMDTLRSIFETNLRLTSVDTPDLQPIFTYYAVGISGADQDLIVAPYSGTAVSALAIDRYMLYEIRITLDTAISSGNLDFIVKIDDGGGFSTAYTRTLNSSHGTNRLFTMDAQGIAVNEGFFVKVNVENAGGEITGRDVKVELMGMPYVGGT